MKTLGENKALFFTMVVALFLAACGTTPEGASQEQRTEESLLEETTAGNDASPIAGTEWKLLSMRGEPPLKTSDVTLSFEKDGVDAYAGCNSMGSGSYTAENGRFKIPGMDSTMMDCGPLDRGVMKQESVYQKTLRAADSYRIENGKLELSAGENTLLIFEKKPEYDMDPADLAGTRWRLVSYEGEPPVAGSVPTLSFLNDRRFERYDGCQDYEGRYIAEGDDLSFPSYGTQDMACMKPEGSYGKDAPYSDPGGDIQYRIAGETLELTYKGGETAVYERLREGEEVKRESTPWSLAAFVESGERTPAPDGITIRFGNTGALRDEGNVAGSTGCGSYEASYEQIDFDLTFENITVEDCTEPALQETERRFLGFLEDTSGYYQKDVDGTLTLRLTASGGRELIFGPPK